MADPPARPFLRRGPSGPLQGDPVTSILQAGYDQSTKTQALAEGDAGGFIPRDGFPEFNPLQVVLEDIVPGNFLEIDWSFTAVANSGGINPVAIILLVFFGDDPPPPLGPGWFIVSVGGDLKEIDTVNDSAPELATLRGLAAFEIPVDVERVTVRLAFDENSNGDSFLITGNDNGFDEVQPASPTLKVYELDGRIVTQPGPIVLTPLVP